MLKTLLVIGFVAVVLGVLWFTWSKVIKPLHVIAVDSELRKGLEQIVEEVLIPVMWEKNRDPDGSARKMAMDASDELFDKIVRIFTTTEEDKDWFYNDTEPNKDKRIDHALQRVPLPGPVGWAIAETYIKFSKFATQHPEAVQWTAFGFMSWVNITIDQILDETYSKK